MPAIVYLNQQGEKVPGVTTVLREWGAKTPALVHAAWKLGFEGKNYRDEWGKKMDAGSLTHRRCEADIRSQPAPGCDGYSAEVVETSDKTFAAYQAWKSGSRLELVASEIPLVHPTLGFGGCLDAVGSLNGQAALIDFKSKTLYAEQIVQVAAYQRLWNSIHPETPLHTVHILGLTEGFHHHQPTQDALDAGWELFLRLLDVYSLKRRVKAA